MIQNAVPLTQHSHVLNPTFHVRIIHKGSNILNGRTQFVTPLQNLEDGVIPGKSDSTESLLPVEDHLGKSSNVLQARLQSGAR